MTRETRGLRRHRAGARLRSSAAAAVGHRHQQGRRASPAPLVAGARPRRARVAALVCGDTTPHAKPHPAPLLEAARRLGVRAGGCVYVGDDLRDVEAGRAAGMRTVAAAWGYLGDGEPPERLGRRHLIARPDELPG